MPATSKKQLALIYAIRNKYKSKSKSPKKWKWVWRWPIGALMKARGEPTLWNKVLSS